MAGIKDKKAVCSVLQSSISIASVSELKKKGVKIDYVMCYIINTTEEWADQLLYLEGYREQND